MMSDTIRVMACLGTNIVGFLIMLTLLAMILSVMIGTGMDPLGMVMEGKEGALLAKHINEKFSEAQKGPFAYLNWPC